MPVNFLLTGPPRSGKTTAIERTVDRLDREVGGVYSPEIRAAGERVGFAIEALDTGETAVMAHVDRADGPTVGAYCVDVTAIEGVAVPAIERGLECDVLVVDEIAPMQLHSDAFLATVRTALASDTPVLGAIQAGESGVVGEIKSSDATVIYEVTAENRDRLPTHLVNELR